MEITEYYSMRRAMQSNAPAPTGDVLIGMQTDLRAALLATGLFHSVEVGRTDDADRLVIAMCGFTPEVDAAEAALALAHLWSKQVAYGFWRVENLRVDDGHIELQGATRFSGSGHYATVHLVAQEAPAPVRTVPLPPRVRQVPSTGIMQAQSVRQSAESARRPRRWFGRPAVA